MSQKESQNQLSLESQESKMCPICLCPIQNLAIIDGCLHEFCFECVSLWSQRHNRCPCCRQSYTRIKHNIQSNTQFEWLWTNHRAERIHRIESIEMHLDLDNSIVDEFFRRLDELEREVDASVDVARMTQIRDENEIRTAMAVVRDRILRVNGEYREILMEIQNDLESDSDEEDLDDDGDTSVEEGEIDDGENDESDGGEFDEEEDEIDFWEDGESYGGDSMDDGEENETDDGKWRWWESQ